MIRRPPRSTHCISSAASDVYKRQVLIDLPGKDEPKLMHSGRLQTTPNPLAKTKGDSNKNLINQLEDKRRKRKEELKVVSDMSAQQNACSEITSDRQKDTTDFLNIPKGCEPSIFLQDSMSPSLCDIYLNADEYNKLDLNHLLACKAQYIYAFCTSLHNL
eukprot:TRINITY_DN7939_c0_g1_i15.p2 TRINITY_DN7939_c0_g1~~TRINITY_DN7939_c0_g1_i15.p2  ORF type:complete len:167 (+),score=32.43 TRINITY_DN7939_c0_g1_i15:24-503(+)